MNTELTHSYSICMSQARRAASNFYYSFFLLPRAKRRAMCALYAFARETDDLGDGTGTVAERRTALGAWRESLAAALAEHYGHPILPALVDTLERYAIPADYLWDVIRGVEMDLEGASFETYAELEQYCYRVASVVGLSCLRIWGFRDARALALAHSCGQAFQLTNILRDLKEDAARGRVYLPHEDLARFNYSADELLRCVPDERFRELMRFQVARAERFYCEAAELPQYLEPDGRRVFSAMLATYHRLLEEIARRDGDVFSTRITLSGWQRIGIAASSIFARPVAHRTNGMARSIAANGSGSQVR